MYTLGREYSAAVKRAGGMIKQESAYSQQEFFYILSVSEYSDACFGPALKRPELACFSRMFSTFFKATSELVFMSLPVGFYTFFQKKFSFKKKRVTLS